MPVSAKSCSLCPLVHDLQAPPLTPAKQTICVHGYTVLVISIAFQLQIQPFAWTRKYMMLSPSWKAFLLVQLIPLHPKKWHKRKFLWETSNDLLHWTVSTWAQLQGNPLGYITALYQEKLVWVMIRCEVSRKPKRRLSSRCNKDWLRSQTSTNP